MVKWWRHRCSATRARYVDDLLVSPPWAAPVLRDRWLRLFWRLPPHDDQAAALQSAEGCRPPVTLASCCRCWQAVSEVACFSIGPAGAQDYVMPQMAQ
jgi:hypothetical protein